MPTTNQSNHNWTFTSLGGFSQARMETAADFANLGSLDLKLWAALACPVKGLAFDEKTLTLLDHDNDGRIRAPEVIAAAAWCTATLNSLDGLAKGGQPLALDTIKTDSSEGKALLGSARRILEGLGSKANTLSVDDAAKANDAIAKSPFNGDGVITDASASDDALKALIGEIVGSLGGVPDRSGAAGADQGKVDAFYADAQAVVDWSAAGTAALMPLGANTAAAADAVAAVKVKVDDYFARCRLAAFDDRALAALNRKEEEYLAIAATDLSVTADEVKGFPLNRISAGRGLALTGAVNPAWADRLSALLTAAVGPLLGADKQTITEADWTNIQARLAPFEAWRAAKPASGVGGLSVDRLKAILAGDGKAALTALIAQDAAVAADVAALGQVERLVRYHRDLHLLARNFVNFADFYTDDARATFQAGTLYLDSRACSLVVRVDDPGKHAALAGRSKLFLAYCDCTRPSGEKLTIAAAYTDGDADYLMVGRNGVFYDRQGRDWDATITKIVENPISLREAFWAPYKKIVKFFEDRAAAAAEAKAAEADKAAMAKAEASAGAPGEAPKPPGVDIGTVAAIAVGLGALGSMAVAIVGYMTGLFAMPFFIIVLVVMALFLSISAPGVVMAWFKLRQRSLGPILDSNGWAVNGRAQVSVRFGATMTSMAELPDGATMSSKDKYADPANPWPGLVKFVVAIGFIVSLLNFYGVIHKLSGGMIGDPANTMELVPAAPAPATEAPATEAPAAPAG